MLLFTIAITECTCTPQSAGEATLYLAVLAAIGLIGFAVWMEDKLRQRANQSG